MTITTSRIRRVIPGASRSNQWESFKRSAAVETVTRDPLPVRAIMAVIMTVLATGVGLTMGGYLLYRLSAMFDHLTNVISSLPV